MFIAWILAKLLSIFKYPDIRIIKMNENSIPIHKELTNLTFAPKVNGLH